MKTLQANLTHVERKPVACGVLRRKVWRPGEQTRTMGNRTHLQNTSPIQPSRVEWWTHGGEGQARRPPWATWIQYQALFSAKCFKLGYLMVQMELKGPGLKFWFGSEPASTKLSQKFTRSPQIENSSQILVPLCPLQTNS